MNEEIKKLCNCEKLEDIEIGYVESGWMWYGVDLDENGELVYEQDEFENYEFGEYWCLTCNVPLDIQSEEEVKALLKLINERKNQQKVGSN